MLATLIENALVMRHGIGVAPGSVLLADGKIAAINLAPHDNRAPQELPLSCQHLDAEGALLTSGLVDIHTHGIHEFLYERSPEDLIAGTQLLPRFGTTCVLPTLYRVLNPPSLESMEKLSQALDSIDGISVPGFHLEGPFLALPGAGAATIPGDLGLLEELLAAANGRVKAMSVSPDCRNILPIIQRLRSAEIAVFLTHTQASVAQTEAAIAAGARHATHFYDVFPVPEAAEAGVRPVGAVEVLLADQGCTVDFICDGVHAHPAAIRLALAAKGWRGVIAITDANIGAGLENGIYDTPWGYSVKVSRNDAARINDTNHPLRGQLAGSSLTMNRAMENLLEWLEIPPQHVWAMATCNAAGAARLSGKGLMQVGADADVVLWREAAGQLKALKTWVTGRLVYECDPTPAAVR